MRFFLLSMVMALALNGAAQSLTYKGYPSLVWPKLYNITFENVRDNRGDYEKPIFSDAVKALEGKTVSLPGYMVPFATTKAKQFMLTSLPLNACFFCGVGGPETVVEINLKEPIPYTEKLVEVKGVLKLNDKNPDAMIYRLEQAEFLGEIDF
jgi:hypothetical protein